MKIENCWHNGGFRPLPNLCRYCKEKDWKKFIINLSELKECHSINPIMAFKMHGNDGCICHCDDGYLCKHRAKWLIKFIEELLNPTNKE